MSVTKTLFAAAAALGLMLGVAAPAQAAPGEPTTVSIGATASVASTTGCEIGLDLTWDETAVAGPSVNVQLFQSVDGEPFQQVGLHQRTEDDGSDSFLRRNIDPERSYVYEVRLTKGPKRLVGIGSTEALSCADGPAPA